MTEDGLTVDGGNTTPEEVADEVTKALQQPLPALTERLARDLIRSLTEAEKRVQRGIAGARHILEQTVIKKSTTGKPSSDGKRRALTPGHQAVLQLADALQGILDAQQVVRQADAVTNNESFTQTTRLGLMVRTLQQVLIDRGIVTEKEVKETMTKILEEDIEKTEKRIEEEKEESLEKSIAEAREGAKERAEENAEEPA